MLFWCARLASTSGYQMLALVLGWQIYTVTGSALDLGLVGLIQFGSLAIAGLWMLFFPSLRRIDRFQPADKEN